MKEKGKENNKEKEFILIRHSQSLNSISICFLAFFVTVTFLIKIVPECTCLMTFSININILILFIYPISPLS